MKKSLKITIAFMLGIGLLGLGFFLIGDREDGKWTMIFSGVMVVIVVVADQIDKLIERRNKK